MSNRQTYHPKRKARQERAAARQAERDARSTEQQVELIKHRRGKSCKELYRLTGQSCVD
jgi:hypothetical protein